MLREYYITSLHILTFCFHPVVSFTAPYPQQPVYHTAPSQPYPVYPGVQQPPANVMYYQQSSSACPVYYPAATAGVVTSGAAPGTHTVILRDGSAPATGGGWNNQTDAFATGSYIYVCCVKLVLQVRTHKHSAFFVKKFMSAIEA